MSLDPFEATGRAYETVTLLRAQCADLEVLAADIVDDEVDRLVEVVRYDVIRLRDRLQAVGIERAAR